MIRETFQDKKEAAIFFKNTLPPEVVKLLNLENLESSFISEELKQEQTDLLFQVWKQNECVSTF
ncbi:transposase, YhgA-like domain protein [Leptospira interrogans serovar Valbuzzi str. Duyster]|nr:Rpn family recombination-promoting nuclease/putative transposase [Leptospira interrogans]EMJ53944.1 transposase, YhgA-like domain protein [Leptospira interrogans serovar Valbuzzi str. Duyster]ENO72246.1 transposase, YhgA-like domain protein [Leptospira interrogans serovar Valbuzzi str. Valbuzzi]